MPSRTAPPTTSQPSLASFDEPLSLEVFFGFTGALRGAGVVGTTGTTGLAVTLTWGAAEVTAGRGLGLAVWWIRTCVGDGVGEWVGDGLGVGEWVGDGFGLTGGRLMMGVGLGVGSAYAVPPVPRTAMAAPSTNAAARWAEGTRTRIRAGPASEV